MIGLLVVTHGVLSKSFLETAQMFVSDVDGVEFVCFTDGQGVEDLKESVSRKLQEMDHFESVLSFVDIPGGSPARVMGELLVQNPKLELITGVNLPILVEAIFSRTTMARKALVDHLITSSRESIMDVGSLLRDS